MDTRTALAALVKNIMVAAMAGHGQKLHVDAAGNLAVDTSMLPCFTRRFAGDSREVTMSAMRRIVDAMCDWAGLLCSVCRAPPVLDSRKEMYEMLVAAATALPNGLRNIKETYADDSIIGALVEELIAKCDAMPRL